MNLAIANPPTRVYRDKDGDVVVVMSTRPWAGRPAVYVRHSVDEDGDVRVFDGVAGHYTRNHSLSARDIGRVRAAARKAAKNPPDELGQSSITGLVIGALIGVAIPAAAAYFGAKAGAKRGR